MEFRGSEQRDQPSVPGVGAEVWEGHPGRGTELHALLCSASLQGTAQLLSAAARESCAASFGRKGGTWKLCPAGGDEVEDLAQVCHEVWRDKCVYGNGAFWSLVTGFNESTGWLLENKHWEHLNHKRYLTFFTGGS